MTSDWQARALSEICDINPESVRGWPAEREIAYIDISSIDPVNGISGVLRMPLATAPSRAQRVVRTGDVLVSTVRTERRAFARVPSSLDGQVASTGFAVLRVREALVDARFLWAAIRSPVFVEEMVSQQVGSNYPAVRPRDVAAFRLALPPLEEQRRIASIVGALDDKIEHNLLLARRLSESAQLLFQRRFGNNAGWPNGSLSDLCTTQYGFTASASEEPVGPKFVRVTDINKRPWIDWANVPYCEIDSKAFESYRLRSGDIVVARMADPGKSAIIDEGVDAVFASYLVRLRTASRAHAYYVYGFLQSDRYAEYAAGAMSGSVQKNMNAKVIVGAQIPIPPHAEMQKHLDEVLPLRERLAAALRENARLSAIRSEILPKLTSGTIRVPESYKP